MALQPSGSLVEYLWQFPGFLHRCFVKDRELHNLWSSQRVDDAVSFPSLSGIMCLPSQVLFPFPSCCSLNGKCHQ